LSSRTHQPNNLVIISIIEISDSARKCKQLLTTQWRLTNKRKFIQAAEQGTQLQEAAM
jgi:hypothetical protein